MAEIDKKYLAGLKFHSSKQAPEGAHIPTERALAPADVLSSRETMYSLTIVTTDGRKYVVDKAAAKSPKEGA
jgi:hypothetical protein